MDRETSKKRAVDYDFLQDCCIMLLFLFSGGKRWEEKEENKKLEGCLGMIV